MSAEANKRAVINYAESVWNHGDLAAVGDFIDNEFVRHASGDPVSGRGPDLIRQLVQIYRGGFPDLHFEAAVVVAEGELVAVRWLMRGMQSGDLPGIPATGRTVTVSATDIYRFRQGKIVEQWVTVDSLSMLQQLGVAAMPTQG